MSWNCTRPIAAATATFAVAALALSGCSGSGAESPAASATPATSATSAPGITQQEIDAAMTTPTTLTFWTWVPDIQNEVDLFEAKYPDIKVNVVNAGQGGPQYTKLRTALQAGTGAPDVVQMEYQYLPSFRLGDNLLDMAPYGAADIASSYAPWIWSQVSDGSAVYGIPQDTGPMGNLYRTDLLEAAKVTPPTTWTDFAAAAAAYRAANPQSYLANLAPNEGGAFVGLLWQAGARPFGYDGDKTVTINLDTPEVAKVVDLWNPLVKNGLVGVDPDFTDQWYQSLANGTYASWQTAAWGPLFLQGTAKDTSGLWRAAPLPTWGSEATSGNWGGSSDAVIKTTPNAIAATQLALFINTNSDSTVQLATKQFLFPATESVLASPEFTDQKLDFYGGQQVNALFADIAKTVPADFAWLPFMDYAFSSFTETVGKAIADRTDLAAGVTAWQAQLVSYAKDQGFAVK